ncbi:Aspyridones efflux protein apdF [Lachnellula suecica]|uniref:Aspyridones efflux protein apdF n=1 Tax=Lachnellula suecica TaxID=602035 RepID=A0A8T9CJE0_9HELO|nr:Aspyridones efflux protein apdF [Lachnellula suecica]
MSEIPQNNSPMGAEKTDVERQSPSQSLDQEHATTKPPAGPTPAPNGGLLAWMHVAGCFMLFFNTWGILNAFGVYQTYYESGDLFHATSSEISWIGSIEAFMLLLVGFFVGPIYDRGFLRTLLLVGGFLVVFGHMMLSLCTAYWQVVLAQGFVIGIGTGFLFVPCVAIIPQYFSTKMGAAMGLAASGSALGGIIYPIVLYKLIGNVGFPWAIRIMGFIALATLLLPIMVLRLRVKPPKVRALLDWSAFTDFHYMAFVFTSLVAYMGLFVILFYLSYYAEAQRITNTSLAFYLVPVFNAASMFGRTIPNALADRWGPFNILAPAALSSGILMLCMMAVNSKGAIIVVALLSGFMSGALIGLPPICFVALTKDKSVLGTRVGMGYAMLSLGVLASGPGGGAILGSGDSLNWHGLWIFGGVATCVSALGYAAIRVSKYGAKPMIKA